jgi:DNA-binding response OmpR family regulator
MNSTRNPRILIVDDEAEIRTLIAEILDHDGFEIQEAGSAEEAVRILEVFAPSLLITDYSLPDANGSELIEKAKGMLPNIKCLMITGWRELSGQLPSPTLADVIVSKPFSVETLEVETRRLLSDTPGEAALVPSVAREAR